MELDDVDDGVARRDQGRLAPERLERPHRFVGTLDGAPLAFKDVGAHRVVDRGEMAVEELLGLECERVDPRAFAQLPAPLPARSASRGRRP